MEQLDEPKPQQTSSMMEEPTWDRETETLTIRFKKGGAYNYPNFSEDLFIEFLTAPSWGKWYHSHKEVFANAVKLKPLAEVPDGNL